MNKTQFIVRVVRMIGYMQRVFDDCNLYCPARKVSKAPGSYHWNNETLEKARNRLNGETILRRPKRTFCKRCRELFCNKTSSCWESQCPCISWEKDMGKVIDHVTKVAVLNGLDTDTIQTIMWTGRKVKWVD